MNNLSDSTNNFPDGILWHGIVKGREYVGGKKESEFIVQLREDWDHSIKSGNVFPLDGSKIRVIHPEDSSLRLATKKVFNYIIKNEYAIQKPENKSLGPVLDVLNRLIRIVESLFHSAIEYNFSSRNFIIVAIGALGVLDQVSRNVFHATVKDAFLTLKSSDSIVSTSSLKIEIADFFKKHDLQRTIHPSSVSSIKQALRIKKLLIKKENPVVLSLLDPLKSKAAISFAEMTRRIPSEKFKKVSEDLGCYPKAMTRFLNAVRCGDLQGILKCKDFAKEALRAFEAGFISKEEFSTIQIYRITVEHIGVENITIVPLFIDGTVNPRARTLIRETFVLRKGFNYQEFDRFPCQNKSFFTDEQEDLFFKEMLLKSSIEQQFLLYHAESSRAPLFGEPKQSVSIMEPISFAKVNMLFSCNQNLRMVPSFSMMQTCLNIKYGKHAVQINPVISISSMKDIESNGLRNQRDMALSLPGVSLPGTADGYKAVGPDFFLHDFFHAIVCSSAPLEHRAFFIRMASLIEKILPIFSEEEKKAVLSFRSRIIDLELSVYFNYLLMTGEVATSHSFLWRMIELFIKQHFLQADDCMSEEVINKLFSAIRDELPEEDFLLLGLPCQLYQEIEKKLVDILVRSLKISKQEAFLLIEDYYSKLESYERDNLSKQEVSTESFLKKIEIFRVRNAELLQRFGVLFWAFTIHNVDEIPFLVEGFKAIRTSPLRSIIKSESWNRPEDAILFPVEENSEKIRMNEFFVQLKSIGDNLSKASAIPEKDRLQFIQKEKSKFDAAIAYAFPLSTYVNSIALLDAFYEALDKNFKMFSDYNDIESIIKNESKLIWLKFTKDSEVIKAISSLFFRYYSVLRNAGYL